MIHNKLIKITLILLVVIIIGCLIFIPLEILFEIIEPPRDTDNHVLMPIGQIILSGIISTIISILIFIILVRKFINTEK